MFHTYNSEIKASLVERFIQTLKEIVCSVSTATDQFHVSYTNLIVGQYNNSLHSSLGGKLTSFDVYKKKK